MKAKKIISWSYYLSLYWVPIFQTYVQKEVHHCPWPQFKSHDSDIAQVEKQAVTEIMKIFPKEMTLLETICVEIKSMDVLKNNGECGEKQLERER